MSLILPESDQIPVLRPPVRLRGSRQIHPFQDIRLALRIITVKNIRGMIDVYKRQPLQSPESLFAAAFPGFFVFLIRLLPEQTQAMP